MGEKLTQQDLALARDPELGPVMADLLVQVQHTLLDEQGHDQVGYPLGRGVDPHQGIACRLRPSPQVDDQLAAVVGRHLRAQAGALRGQDRRELLAYRLEPGRHRALHIADLSSVPLNSTPMMPDRLGPLPP